MEILANLYLILVIKEELVRDVETGCCDPEIAWFQLPRGLRKDKTAGTAHQWSRLWPIL